MPRPVPLSPRPGQESVWDYPRPPRIERVRRRATVELGGVRIADTADLVRVLETSHPPVYYLPFDAFAPGALRPASGSSFCEYKGRAAYYDVSSGTLVRPGAAWTYPEPPVEYAELASRVAVYAAAVDACTLDGEVVTPQPGGFYGGWITSDLVGPFKGVPGSTGW